MWDLNGIFSEFDYMVDSELSEVSFDERATELKELYEMLEFFFKKGNHGINALRELLEDFNDDTVDFNYENEDKQSVATLSICYKYHDFEIQCITRFNDNMSHSYKLIDTSRRLINKIKAEFKQKTKKHISLDRYELGILPK